MLDELRKPCHARRNVSRAPPNAQYRLYCVLSPQLAPSRTGPVKVTVNLNLKNRKIYKEKEKKRLTIFLENSSSFNKHFHKYHCQSLLSALTCSFINLK